MADFLARASRPRFWYFAAIFTVYLLLAVATTWPLVRDMRTAIAGDAADPVLNAAVLVWNATTVPFSKAWWNPPHYYPREGVVAFTESLIGISPLFSPVYWLTGNAILAYNVAVLLTWPLSAVAAFLLARFLTGRDDAAFLAGLSFGFSPYRAVAFPHIQTLATFGVAFFLLGMHGYITYRRWPWLVLVGVGWLQQSFANGYYALYGGLIIGCWLLYFCTRRETWKQGLVIVSTLAIASLPLLPMLLGFRAVHERYGLHRSYFEILYFSALTHSWFETHDSVWLWHLLFPPGKDDMFPGITAVAIIGLSVSWLLTRRQAGAETTISHLDGLRRWLAIGTAVGVAAILINIIWGRIDTTVAGIPVKMTDVSRAVIGLVACGVPLIWLTPRTRRAIESRSPLVFYVATAIVIAVLSFGPELRAGDDVIWKPAPYGWLMALPGFNEVRVPTQIKMIDILCLAIAAALAYQAVVPTGSRRRVLVGAIASLAMLVDGWIVHAHMATAPEIWSVVEPSGRPEPILELPFGGGDYGATFRATIHRRHVFNGVSGYDPPHYLALKEGLTAHDPSMLAAIGTLGTFDVVVNGDEDPDGAEHRYVLNAPGAIRLASDGRRTLYRIPQRSVDPAPGTAWPIVSVSVAHHEEWKSLMIDGNPDTGWADLPAYPDAWVIADLGEAREVGGLTELIGDYPADFPRYLIIEVSLDGEAWERAWEGATSSQAFLGFVRQPRRAELCFRFATRPARYIRLRQTERPTNWRIQELRIHAPSS